MGDFQTQLAFGHTAETKIARYLRSRGSVIMPVYDLEYDTGKGPQVFWGPNSQAAAPDLLIWKNDQSYFIEAKHKSRFTWYRKKQTWCTGIDRHHYSDYQRVVEVIHRPVWLFFLHEYSNPDPRDLRYKCPTQCPTGLFIGNLSNLINKESHQHWNWGKTGMVYWAEESLIKIAEIDNGVLMSVKQGIEF